MVILGVWSRDRSLVGAMMARMSGNPSRLKSPSLSGTGSGGLWVVSNTRSTDKDDLVGEGNSEEMGIFAIFCSPIIG